MRPVGRRSGGLRSLRRSAAVLLTFLTFVSFQATNAAEHDQDRIRLEQTVISGNQELPKVLYILPWQSPEGRPDLALDAGLKDQNVLRRVYPPAHRRELRYWNGLKALEGPDDGNGKRRD
jgi:hypothetical protein